MATTPNLGMTLLQAGQLQPEVTVNGDLNILDAAVGGLVSAFGYDPTLSTGLTYAYFGGVVLVNATPTPIAAGTVSLTASATNYVQRSPDGSSVTVNTTGWTPGMVPMAEVVTNATNITTVTDMRPSNTTKAGRLVIGVGAPTGVSVSTSATGGSLAASTAYEYQVTAVYPWGESAPSAPVSVTTGSSTSTNENTVSWTVPAGALSVNVYGRVAGSIAKIANVLAATASYVDTGSVAPSGVAPANGSLLLSEAQANATILSFEGAIAAATKVDLPSRPQQWVASNETTGAYVLTLTTSSATNSGVVPAQGSAEIVYVNGTNLIAASSSGGGGGGGSSGAVMVNTTGGTVTLTSGDAKNAIIQIEGALTSDAEVVFPASLAQVWELSNQTTGSYTLTAIVSGSTATALTIEQGTSQSVWSDGTNLHMTTGAQGPQGPAGPTGPTGPQGPAGTISIGTTTTGASGSSASVTNSGTSTAAVLNFTIPQGPAGPAGSISQAGSTVNQAILVGDSEQQVTNTASGTAATINQADGNVQMLTLTGNCTLTFEAANSGTANVANSMVLILTQGSSGGPFTVTWPSGTIFAAGSAPTLSTTAGQSDIFVCMLLAGSSNWVVFVVQQGVTL